MRSFEHFAQAIRHGTFAQYDFGAIENLIVYHSLSPPAWNVSVIRTPTALFWGGADTLGDNADVQSLLKAIAPEFIVTAKFLPSYAHLDFVWGESANVDVYAQVVDLARKYS